MERGKATTHCDILVVGMGPVGALLALLLGRRGIRTTVIDRQTAIAEHPRAIALDNEALRILAAAGVRDRFETLPIPEVRMQSPRFGCFARSDTNMAIEGEPALVTFYQPDLERALRAAVAEHPSVACRPGNRLVRLERLGGDGVAAIIEGDDGRPWQIIPRFVVGADGANSTVRRQLGIGFTGKSYPQDWLIVDALDVPGFHDHVEFLCDCRRPAPHMPAPGGRRRWEFMMRPGDGREAVLEDGFIRDLLMPWSGGAPIRIERKAIYRFHARLADRFSTGRVFLAGDAAHITPPFAGQGLVAGMRDAFNLAWKLAWVIEGRAGADLLDSYEVERRPHAAAMIDFALTMGRAIMPTAPWQAWCTHGTMKALRAIPPIRRRMEAGTGKPSPQLRAGYFVAGGNASTPSGSPLPQTDLVHAAGRVVASDHLLGRDLTLVTVGGALSPGVAMQLDANQLAIDAPEGGWRDPGGRFAPGHGQPWLFVVRPDRVILHQGPLAEAARLIGELPGRAAAAQTERIAA